MNLECPSGIMDTDQSMQFGMMSENTGAMIYCTKDAWKLAEKDNKIADCTEHLSKSTFDERLQACKGKTKCKVDITGLQSA
jgi:hypothetical protein